MHKVNVPECVLRKRVVHENRVSGKAKEVEIETDNQVVHLDRL
jgi:hypothetical protein